MNNVNLSPSLWLYVIHSQNAELIHLLESLEVRPPSNKYEKCFAESIKCHNNDIAYYLENNLLPNGNEARRDEAIILNVLKFHNFAYFPSDLRSDDEFFYLCYYDYHTIADLFLRREIEISKEMNYDDVTLIEAASMNIIIIVYYHLLKRNKINNFTFLGSKGKLKKVAIPPTITSIGFNTFNGCSSLTHVSIPSSVTSIGGYAFSGCSSLTQIAIPSSVTSIGNYAFEGCLSLTQIIIPSSVTSIGYYAFAYCRSLVNTSISFSVSLIEYCTYLKCESLKQITIPSSVKSIEFEAFYACRSLRQVTLSSSLLSIGSNAFAFCNSLEKITIPNSVESIGGKDVLHYHK